jgi:pimeloyl-ACP methyl ester carboxylesterase
MNAGTWLLVAAALPFAALLWAMGIRRWYRIRGPRPRLLRTECADGWSLGVFHRPARIRRYAEPVLLAHGLSVTHVNMDFEPPYSLAHALSDAGFECFSVDWRGNGASGRPPPGRRGYDYCADDHIAQDAPAFLARALAETGASQALWVGHSMGGLVGYALTGRPEGEALRGIATLGSPAFFRAPTRRLLRAVRLTPYLAWPRRIRQRLATLALAPLIGWVALPLADAIVNPEHVHGRVQRKLFANLFVSVSRKILLQFRDWVLHDAFRSFDRKTDYRAAMARARTPALIAAGSVDKLAPAASVRAAFEMWGAADKTLLVFGRERGDAMDYGHGDLVFGRGAPTEVYPVLQKWLEAHATAISSADKETAPAPSPTAAARG